MIIWAGEEAKAKYDYYKANAPVYCESDVYDYPIRAGGCLVRRSDRQCIYIKSWNEKKHIAIQGTPAELEELAKAITIIRPAELEELAECGRNTP